MDLNFLSNKKKDNYLDDSLDSLLKKRLRTPIKSELIKNNEFFCKEDLISSFEQF